MSDTPSDYIEYAMLEASFRDHPLGVARLKHDMRDALSDVSTVNLHLPASEVTSIRVLAQRASDKTDSVYCDRAIIFEHADNRVFSLASSLRDWLALSLDSTVAQDLQAKYETRLHLQV